MLKRNQRLLGLHIFPLDRLGYSYSIEGHSIACLKGKPHFIHSNPTHKEGSIETREV